MNGTPSTDLLHIMENDKLKGPYEIEMHVHVTDGARTFGKISVNLKLADVPTQEDIDECLAMAKEKAEESGFRLMNKMEFFNLMMRERLGAREDFACPGSEDWDV